MKKAEDSDDIIVRLYDNQGIRTTAELEFGINLNYAKLCDLSENDLGDLVVKDNKVKVNVKPFEIVTIRLVVE
ncbi:MAG: glycosyl hydrolase-related protein [Oscillospiraceae bacterium]